MKRKCLVCGKELLQGERVFRCEKGHSFDVAAAGYVNLLAPQKGAKNHGDTKEMVAARSHFLRGGFYQPLSDKINEQILKNKQDTKNLGIIDAGCGEGYYTERLYNALRDAGISADMQGYDVSKQAIISAAKSEKGISYGVASLFGLPVMDREADVVLNLFAPICLPEFKRVLKKDGILVVVAPNTDHLWGLKSALYEKPYKNTLSDINLDGFKLIENINIEYKITVKDENIENLFSMTPYYWKTSLSDKAKLAELKILNTEVHFALLVYRKGK